MDKLRETEQNPEDSMADEIHGQKMSDYTKLNELTQAEQETYLANAAVTTYGKTSDDGNNTNVNVPLSAIKPDVPVTDVTVGGNSVVSNGVAAVPAQENADWKAASGVTAILNKPDLSIYALESALEALEAKYTSLDARVTKLEGQTT
jgi:hypothetical protein